MLTRRVLIQIGLSVSVVTFLALTSPRPARTQEGKATPMDVRVVNTSAGPVPTTVLNAPSAPVNAKLVNTSAAPVPTTVLNSSTAPVNARLVNTTTAPVPAKILNDGTAPIPAKVMSSEAAPIATRLFNPPTAPVPVQVMQAAPDGSLPFQAEFRSAANDQFSVSVEGPFYVVPAGMRAIVETATVEGISTCSDNLLPYVRAFVRTNGLDHTISTGFQSIPGKTYLSATWPVALYANPGTTITGRATSSIDNFVGTITLSVRMTVSGRLVRLP